MSKKIDLPTIVLVTAYVLQKRGYRMTPLTLAVATYLVLKSLAKGE